MRQLTIIDILYYSQYFSKLPMRQLTIIFDVFKSFLISKLPMRQLTEYEQDEIPF